MGMLEQAILDEEIKKNQQNADYFIKLMKDTGRGHTCIGLSTDVFPESLFNPLFSECCMDDGYGLEEDHEIENIVFGISPEDAKKIESQKSRVMNLKKRYNSIESWYEAMDVYDEYMRLLAPRWGNNKKGFKYVMKHPELLEDIFIPDRPKYKKTAENKAIAKSGMRPSKQVEGWVVKYPEVPKMTQEELDEFEVEIEYVEEMPKKERKFIEAAMKKAAQQSRVSNMYSRLDKNPGFDVVIDFWAEQVTGRCHINSEGKNEPESLSERIKRMKHLESLSPTELAMLDDDGFQIIEGRYVRNSELDRQALYRRMMEIGMDVGKMLKTSGLSKQHQKIIMRKIGYVSESMSRKDQKKRAKMEKKLAEKQKRHDAADKELTRLLCGNFLGDETIDVNKMMNFTMASIMDEE